MFSVERRRSSTAVRNTELTPILEKVHIQPGQVTRNTGKHKSVPSNKWPWIYLLVVKILCIFTGHRVVSSRQCHSCRLERLHREREVNGNKGPLPNYLFPSAIDTPAGWTNDVLLDGVGEGTSRDQRIECDVCCSNWWNADGQYKVYSEKDVGVAWWNHRWSKQVSILLLLSLMVSLFHEGVLFLIPFWGDGRYLLSLLSYFAYLFNIGIVPSLLIVANLRNIVQRQRVHHFSWTTALHPCYLIKRFQYIRPSSGAIKKPFLVICLVWPFITHAYRIVIFFMMVRAKDYGFLHSSFTLFTDACAKLIWGCFCYLIIIVRVSIETQLNLDVAFLQKHIGKIDLCRRRLAASLDEYGSLCNLCALWMIPTICSGTVGVATHVSFNYRLFSGHIEYTRINIHVVIFKWCELLMILSLPLMAVGGFDLHHIWKDVLGRIHEIRRDEYEDFWKKICTFVNEFNPVTHVGMTAFVFTFISLYMALNIDDTQLVYYNGGIYNGAPITSANTHDYHEVVTDA